MNVQSSGSRGKYVSTRRKSGGNGTSNSNSNVDTDAADIFEYKCDSGSDDDSGSDVHYKWRSKQVPEYSGTDSVSDHETNSDIDRDHDTSYSSGICSTDDATSISNDVEESSTGIRSSSTTIRSGGSKDSTCSTGGNSKGGRSNNGSVIICSSSTSNSGNDNEKKGIEKSISSSKSVNKNCNGFSVNESSTSSLNLSNSSINGSGLTNAEEEDGNDQVRTCVIMDTFLCNFVYMSSFKIV